MTIFTEVMYLEVVIEISKLNDDVTSHDRKRKVNLSRGENIILKFFNRGTKSILIVQIRTLISVWPAVSEQLLAVSQVLRLRTSKKNIR